MIIYCSFKISWLSVITLFGQSC